MRIFSGIILLLLFSLPAFGHHLIGGEMYYTFVKKTSQGYQYKVILKLYRGCEPMDQEHSNLDPSAVFSIFDNDNSSLYSTTEHIFMDKKDSISEVPNNPCISNPPRSCFKIGYYKTTITLPLNKNGYTISYQRCCRNDLLKNANTSNYVGATYFTVIPGQISGIPGDSGPFFKNDEAVLFCSRGSLDYTFKAYDPDGDELRYDFVPGYTGGTQSDLIPVPTSRPPFNPFQYYSGFSGTSPLGDDITLDSLTGRMHGRTNLDPGDYDITIRVHSYRGGKLIATHYHDFQFKVHDCQRTVLADIPPLYNDCTNNTIQFANNSTPGKTYLWDFDDGTTSNQKTPTHTFNNPGTYHVKIKVDPTSNCGDSMETVVKIFPKVDASFKKVGNCVQSPIEFTDESTTTVGNIVSRHWDFGEQNSAADTSNLQNPQYKYTSDGTFPVKLTITTDSGCVQTYNQTFQFYDKPDLQVTPDSILCYKDPIHLKTNSPRSGNYLWAPDYFMNDPSISDPIVHPKKDTTYKVVFTDNLGCVNTDSVYLRVKHSIQVNAGNDTTICAGDQVSLHASSDENYAFSWYDLNNQLIGTGRTIHPATPTDETYKVVASLGSCSADDNKKVTAIPYPNAAVNPPKTGICYGDSVMLVASGGSSYQWNPQDSLSDPSASSLFANPTETTNYTLTVTDTLGCPKPIQVQVPITVIPPVEAFAGNDTIITIGQSFQLQASGGDSYNWTPVTGLSDPNIANPVVNRNSDIIYNLKVTVSPQRCVDYDSIFIRYIKGPEVYVPSAFTPNGDGENDIFRPIPVGITKILYFRVYNRWGQLVYQTTSYMKGWDGTYKGKLAEPGAYVWMVKAKDFNGHSIVEKGSVLLIR